MTRRRAKAPERRVTDLELYCEDVVAGREVTSLKVRALCRRLLDDMRDESGRWEYDPDLAEKPIEFIEQFCKIPSGRLGRPMRLERYEKAWIESIFGFVDRKTRLRRFREALIIVGRKNGKTSLMAAVELYMLIADGEGAPQVYNAANSREQATLGYNAAVRMVRQSGDISAHVHKRAEDLYCDLNMGYIKALSANDSNLDGLDAHAAVIDEIHAARTRDVYDLLKQATGAREQPLIIQITTNGFVRNSIFDQQYDYGRRWLDGDIDDEQFIAWMYELDDVDEWQDESCWKKANPGLGSVKSMDYLRAQVEKARNDPSYRGTVLTKDFNMPQNASTAWLSFDECVNTEVVDMDAMGFRYGICGFDASEYVDLTAAQVLMMRPGDDRIYERSMYWLPEDVVAIADEDGGRDRDMAPYRLWASRGLLRLVPGNRIDPLVLLDWLEELRDEHDLYTYAIGYDPWHIDTTTKSKFEQFVGKGRALPVVQGARTLSMPMKSIRADYKAGRLVDNHNPMNEWCRMNVQVKRDINQNLQPEKRMLNPRNRIDGWAAEIDAYVLLQNLMEDYSQVC